MKQSLINHICCPKCKGKIRLTSKKSIKNEIIEGLLQCLGCKEKFPIKKGVPRFVKFDKSDFKKTEDAFSAKWTKYNKIYQDKNWYDFQKKWFLDRFGWKTLPKFNKFLNSCKKILDAGTGLGNSAKLFSHNPKSEVFAIDASDSIDFAYKKYGSAPNVHFLQADLRNLPFKNRFFDFVCSDQVLHHTKDTESSFKYLCKLLNSQGMISIYVYKKKAPMREYADDYIRQTTVNMSEKDCIEFSKQMTILGRSLSKLKKKITIPKDIPVLGIKSGKYDVQRFIYWNFLKCYWAEDENFERSVGVNFDWYYPKFAYRHTPKEVKKWCKDSKLKITHINEIESGLSISAKKT